MISNLAIKICFSSLLWLQISGGLLAQSAQWECIQSLAHINGKIKEVDGVKYHLIAMKLRPLTPNRLLDGAYTAWLVNGQRGRDVMLPLEAGDQIFGGGASSRWVLLQWVKLPKQGVLEILTGLIDTSDFDPSDLDNSDAVRKELLERYLPYRVKVESLPPVNVVSRDDLVKSMDYLAHYKGSIRVIAHVNGEIKTVDRQAYYLFATLVKNPLVGHATGTQMMINGRKRDGYMLKDPPSVFQPRDTLPSDVLLSWIRVPKSSKKMVFLYGDLRFEPEDNDPRIQEKLLQRGYFPYLLDTTNPPKVSADSATELATKLKMLEETKSQTIDSSAWKWWSAAVR